MTRAIIALSIILPLMAAAVNVMLNDRPYALVTISGTERTVTPMTRAQCAERIADIKRGPTMGSAIFYCEATS